MAKAKMEAKAERRCARCKKLSRAMLKNGEGHHSDDAVKEGYELRCEKIALCIAAFRVAALWCTKLLWPERPLTPSPNQFWEIATFGPFPRIFKFQAHYIKCKFSSLKFLGRHACRTKLPPKKDEFDTKNG